MESVLANHNSISHSNSAKLAINEETIWDEEQEEISQESRSCCRIRWKPTSMREFAAAEKQLLSYNSLEYELKVVAAGEILQSKYFWQTPELMKIKISTVIVAPSPPPSPNNQKLPIVLIHGVGVGKACFSVQLRELCKERTVYAFDLPGYGRSTRIKFPKDAAAAEETNIKIVEAWRKAIGLEKFILVGHSFGGFIATGYALQFPERVAHLVALDPWGYPEKPKTVEVLLGIRNPLLIRIMDMWTQRFNLFCFVRILGPCGKPCVDRINHENCKTVELYGDGMEEAVNSYVYHCLAKKPSGETAFRHMTTSIVYAKRPLYTRLHLLNPAIPVTVYHPEEMYVPAIPEEELRSLLAPGCVLRVVTLPSTNHDSMVLSLELARELWAITE